MKKGETRKYDSIQWVIDALGNDLIDKDYRENHRTESIRADEDLWWCPECKNAWSWSKGVVVHGYIHNPHFFEYQRKMKGRVDRAPGDVPCGGIPTAYQWRILTDNKNITTNIQTFLSQE